MSLSARHWRDGLYHWLLGRPAHDRTVIYPRQHRRVYRGVWQSSAASGKARI